MTDLVWNDEFQMQPYHHKLPIQCWKCYKETDIDLIKPLKDKLLCPECYSKEIMK